MEETDDEIGPTVTIRIGGRVKATCALRPGSFQDTAVDQLCRRVAEDGDGQGAKIRATSR